MNEIEWTKMVSNLLNDNFQDYSIVGGKKTYLC